MPDLPVILEARTYLGTPYHHAGRLKGVGIDCVGIVTGLCRTFGVTFEDVRCYDRFGRGADLPRELGRWLRPVGPDEARPGDVQTFWVRRPNHVCHCGILTPVGVLHTHGGVGKVVEHRVSDEWAERRSAAFRLPLTGES